MNKNGFTLAEVLITLGIIGVVAAMTIPVLMNNIQDAQFKVAYKKAYSVASQAWQKAYADYLLTPRAADNSDPINDNNFNAFKSEFSVAKDCNSNNNSECWTTDGYKWDTSFPDSSGLAFIDKSGMVWSQPVGQHYYLFVDTNGSKKPNDWGKDRFPFFPDATNGKLIFDTDIASPAGSCPNSAHYCWYTSWITGAK